MISPAAIAILAAPSPFDGTPESTPKTTLKKTAKTA
jgi:hypothetical protein